MLDPTDTIAAVATAPGGGVGIVRLSGPASWAIALDHLLPRPRRVEVRRVYHGWWTDARGDRVDEALVTFFRGPKSYTGEDVVEVSVHGGALTLRRTVEVCWAAGARAAQPGEFTRRAFESGRLDLTQAEAVADLVAARSDRALAQARLLLAGALGDAAQDARRRTLALLAQVEAAIDFVEEDLDVLDAPRLGEQATALAQELAALAATSRRGRLLREGARLSLAGPPNAGKSSLFNALCGHDRAIVTPHAGTTRDVLEETIDVRGVPAVLADTAGLRDTADPVESVGVDRARRHVEASDLVIYLHDGATEPGESSALAFETPPGVPVVEVTSKVDLPHAHVRPGTLGVSVVTGEGLDELLDRVARDLGVLDGDSGLVVTRERHRAALDEAARALHAAAEGLSHQAPLELVALDLRESLEALGTLVGETTPEDVLGEIFSTFCVGK